MKLRLREKDACSLNWVNATSQWLRSSEDLVRLDPAFDRSLSRELGVYHLSDRLCPALLSNGKAALFCLQTARFEDQTLATLDLLVARGYEMATPAIFLVPLSLLLSLNEVGSSKIRHTSHPSMDQPGQRSSVNAAFDEILQWACLHRASDIHMNVLRQSALSEIRFTLGGKYVLPDRFARMPSKLLLDMLSVIWMDVIGGNGAVFDPNIEQQGRFNRMVDGKQVQLRWASLATDRGPSVCLRLLMLDQAESTVSLSGLGYLPSQVQALERCQSSPGGVIVLAGTVGAGKSTTIATMMRSIPLQRKVITIEDPVEYLISNALQNTVARDLGQDDLSAFDAKLKTVKRCAMNDLLIGEIRDQVGGRALIDLAGTGVSLYTTLHASSALLIPERLASEMIGVPRDLLSTPGVLKLLVYQRLMPTLCQHCALDVDQVMSQENWRCSQQIVRTMGWKKQWLDDLRSTLNADISRIRFRQQKGCDSCRKQGLSELNGLSGRTVVAEWIEPAVEPDFLACLALRDPISLYRWFDSRSRSALGDVDMAGKCAQDCAIYKVLVGLIDPREVEVQFSEVNRWRGGRLHGC